MPNEIYKSQIVAKQDNTGRVKTAPRIKLNTNKTQSVNKTKKIVSNNGPYYNYYAYNIAKSRIAKAVDVARQEYKKGGVETSTNDSSQIRKYKFGEKNEYDWCSFFANYCYTVGQGKTTNLFGLENKEAGASQLIKCKAKQEGYFTEANTGYIPKVGDLAIWTSKKDKKFGHIGIVSKVYDDGSYDVIEGNKDDKISEIHYKSQAPKDANLKTKYFAGFVRMEDYLYDQESWKITASLTPDEKTQDLYEKDEQSDFGFMA